jgi:hypothetical protein
MKNKFEVGDYIQWIPGHIHLAKNPPVARGLIVKVHDGGFLGDDYTQSYEVLVQGSDRSIWVREKHLFLAGEEHE